MDKGCRYGTHRVITPEGTLPQPALRLDNTMSIYDNELLIDVQTLNIDSASYTQIKSACNGDADKMKEMILSIVAERGKMQNPVTGSGGMLIGTVKEIGPNFPDKSLKIGDKIATLVSLSLTPLKINKIKHLDPASDQVDVDAQAILFESGLYAVLPNDIPEKLALAVLDVAFCFFYFFMSYTCIRAAEETIKDVRSGNVPQIISEHKFINILLQVFLRVYIAICT